jgi:hypothetical protein
MKSRPVSGSRPFLVFSFPSGARARTLEPEHGIDQAHRMCASDPLDKTPERRSACSILSGPRSCACYPAFSKSDSPGNSFSSAIVSSSTEALCTIQLKTRSANQPSAEFGYPILPDRVCSGFNTIILAPPNFISSASSIMRNGDSALCAVIYINSGRTSPAHYLPTATSQIKGKSSIN